MNGYYECLECGEKYNDSRHLTSKLMPYKLKCPNCDSDRITIIDMDEHELFNGEEIDL